jgi:hypothetical protein
VDGVFVAQPLEVAPERVGFEELRIRDIDLVERNGVGIDAGLRAAHVASGSRCSGGCATPEH